MPRAYQLAPSLRKLRAHGICDRFASCGYQPMLDGGNRRIIVPKTPHPVPKVQALHPRSRSLNTQEVAAAGVNSRMGLTPLSLYFYPAIVKNAPPAPYIKEWARLFRSIFEELLGVVSHRDRRLLALLHNGLLRSSGLLCRWLLRLSRTGFNLGSTPTLPQFHLLHLLLTGP